MSKPQAVRPPSHLSRSDKAAFRRIVEHLSGTETGVSDVQVDLIADLVGARRRIATLSRMLEQQASYSEEHEIVRKEVIALCSQINTTTSLAHRLAARLGIGK